MNFIDISSWQHGLSLEKLYAENPLDGVVVKATEGTGYTNPDLKGWADWLIEHGKPLGLYHFMSGLNAASEAAYFVSVCRPYLGKAVLCADYEADAVKKGTGYLKDFLDAVTELAGVKPLVYCSLSVVQWQDFKAIAAAGYKLWLAQYASNNVVNGFQENPWQSGSVSPFNGFVMHQYTGNGRLKSYSGALDLDKYYGSYSSWMEMAEGAGPALKPADPEIVMRVLDGEFGINAERVEKLRAAGYDPTSVQDMVNTCYGLALTVKKTVGAYMPYMECIAKIAEVL